VSIRVNSWLKFCRVGDENLHGIDRPNEVMITRLSGTLAERPDPKSAVGARYYATDEQKVYASGGESWYLEPGAPEQENVAGYLSGPLSDRPSDPAGHIGWIFTDSDTGNQYEAFPTDWALVDDVTPPAPGGGGSFLSSNTARVDPSGFDTGPNAGVIGDLTKPFLTV
jgi:hypothetical protein